MARRRRRDAPWTWRRSALAGLGFILRLLGGVTLAVMAFLMVLAVVVGGEPPPDAISPGGMAIGAAIGAAMFGLGLWLRRVTRDDSPVYLDLTIY